MAAAGRHSGRPYDSAPSVSLGTVRVSNGVPAVWELSRLSLGIGFWDIAFPQFVQGIGFGTIFVALSTAALSAVSKPKMQAATGLYNVVRLVFGSMGIAIAATELDRGAVLYGAALMRNVTEYRDTTLEWVRTLSEVKQGRSKTSSHRAHRVYRENMNEYCSVFPVIPVREYF